MRFVLKNAEGFAWIAALTLPVFITPGSDDHFSWCFFKNVGIDWCPGCGLGDSLAYLYRGNITASFYSHPLGIFAVIILLLRIFNIFFKRRFQLTNQLLHEPETIKPDSRS